jgi:hypothetical protein
MGGGERIQPSSRGMEEGEARSVESVQVRAVVVVVTG